jgi:hypothetical protein
MLSLSEWEIYVDKAIEGMKISWDEFDH